MKRTYTKPLIAMESFQLNAAIAAACSSSGYTKLGFYETSCSYPPKSDQYFSQSTCQIDLTGDDNKYGAGGTEYDTLCYHGPTSEVFIYS